MNTTLGQMKDQIRRHLGITPPIDDPEVYPHAMPGDAPDYAPVPTNPTIEQFIQNAVSDINLDAGSGFETNILSRDVEAQTENGPLRIPLSGEGFTINGQVAETLDGFSINRVRDAWWIMEDGGATRLMWARDLDTLARDRYRYMSYPPGTPFRYAIEGYAIWLIPAPAAAGTLQIRAGLGILPPLTNSDTLNGMPADCASSFVDIVAFEIADAMPDNPEMQAKVARLAPKAERSRQRILLTMHRMPGLLDDHMTVQTYRRGFRK